MPLAFRAKGTSFSTATNWAFNYLVGEATPILQEKIKWRLYFMHAGFCVLSFFLVYFCYPETMGVPLEVSGWVFSFFVLSVLLTEDHCDLTGDGCALSGRGWTCSTG